MEAHVRVISGDSVATDPTVEGGETIFRISGGTPGVRTHQFLLSAKGSNGGTEAILIKVPMTA